jgi:hypothetical protein
MMMMMIKPLPQNQSSFLFFLRYKGGDDYDYHIGTHLYTSPTTTMVGYNYPLAKALFLAPSNAIHFIFDSI